MRRVLLLPLVLFVTCAAGDPRLGDSTRANFAAMIVPPKPPLTNAFEGGNGIMGVEATRRYLTNKVKQPTGADSVKAFSGTGASSGSR